jgi:hypothetical protein
MNNLNISQTGFPLEASCDLLKNETSSLESSIINSVEVDGVLGSNVLLARRWLHAPHVVFPQCPPGAVLVGSYCCKPLFVNIILFNLLFP